MKINKYKFIDSNKYLYCLYDKTMYNIKRIVIIDNNIIQELKIKYCSRFINNKSCIIEIDNNTIYFLNDDKFFDSALFGNKLIIIIKNTPYDKKINDYFNISISSKIKKIVIYIKSKLKIT
jgi:hypothetical protein